LPALVDVNTDGGPAAMSRNRHKALDALISGSSRNRARSDRRADHMTQSIEKKQDL
jgi:hypothetical protein